MSLLSKGFLNNLRHEFTWGECLYSYSILEDENIVASILYQGTLRISIWMHRLSIDIYNQILKKLLD